MQTIGGFDFWPLAFDEHGTLSSRQQLDSLIAHANASDATDAIFIAHGFRNDEHDATTLYTKFLETLRAHLARPEFVDVAARRFVVAAVYWPSKPFREAVDSGTAGTRALQPPSEAMADLRQRLEELKNHDASPSQRPKLEKAIALLPKLEGDPEVQDEFVHLVWSLVEHSALDKTEGLPQMRKLSGSELLARLAPPQADGTRGLGNVAGAIAGGVGQFLNLTTWYVMKDRSGTVGASGVADAMRALHAARPPIRLHMVGHSLGGRVAAACAKALCSAPPLELDSLTLLEGAFSHFGFSPDNGHHTQGFFRDVVVQQIVKGPFISTFSAQDTVVGKAYSIMSRLAGDNTREIGDARDEFGGLGRNGTQKTTEVTTARLNEPGTPYQFQPHVINNLDGSGGLIKNHGDIANSAVTYAFASALALT